MSTAPITPADPRVVAGAAVAESVLTTVGGPLGTLASQLLAGGLAYWAAYAGKLAGGTLTPDDVRAAAALTMTDMAKLEADFAAAEKARALGFQPAGTKSV